MPYTWGEGGEKNIFVSQPSTHDPCNLCPYRSEIQCSHLLENQLKYTSLYYSYQNTLNKRELKKKLLPNNAKEVLKSQNKRN